MRRDDLCLLWIGPFFALLCLEMIFSSDACAIHRLPSAIFNRGVYPRRDRCAIPGPHSPLSKYHRAVTSGPELTRPPRSARPHRSATSQFVSLKALGLNSALQSPHAGLQPRARWREGERTAALLAPGEECRPCASLVRSAVAAASGQNKAGQARVDDHDVVPASRANRP